MKKLFIFCLLIILFYRGSCDQRRNDSIEPVANHPKWMYFKMGDQDIAKTNKAQSIITALGWGCVQVRVGKDQIYLAKDNPSMQFSDFTQKNQVIETHNGDDWLIITGAPNKPGYYGKWAFQEFGKKYSQKANKKKIDGHISSGKEGVPVYAIKGLLALAGELDIIIISTGIENALGVSKAAKAYLNKLKEQGKIKGYEISPSEAVPVKHNEAVKAGKKVGTLLHTIC